jgi:hypothetical protein
MDVTMKNWNITKTIPNNKAAIPQKVVFGLDK